MVNHKKLKHQAKLLGMNNRSKFALTTMAKDFNRIVDDALRAIPETPKPMALKLPKLKKKTDSKPATIKLPKLKKVT